MDRIVLNITKSIRIVTQPKTLGNVNIDKIQRLELEKKSKLLYICVKQKHVPFLSVLSFTKTTVFVVFSFRRLLSTAAYNSPADFLLNPGNQNNKINQFQQGIEKKRKMDNLFPEAMQLIPFLSPLAPLISAVSFFLFFVASFLSTTAYLSAPCCEISLSAKHI